MNRRAPTAGRRVGRRVLTVGALVLVPPVAFPAPAIGARAPLTFVSQSTTVTADGTFSIVVQAPTDVAADAVLRIASHEAVTTRQQVRASIGGKPTALLDQLDIPLAAIPRTPEGALEVTVATESMDVDATRLQIRSAGFYPLTLELVEGDQTSEALTTFVERLGDPAAGDPRIVPLAVGFAAGVNAPPTLQTDGSTVIRATTRADLAALATLLEQATTDIAVSLRPELVDGLARSTDPVDTALLARLSAALATRHQLLSEPYVGVSPSFAVAGSQTKLFADELRRGEDVLSARLGGVDTDRATWFVTEPIDAAGLNLLRELGVRRLIIDASMLPVDETVAAQGIDGRLRAVDVASSDRIPVLISDPFLQQILAAPTDNPALLAHQLLADMTGLQLEASTAAINGPATRAVMFTISDPSTVNLELIHAVMSSIADYPRLKPAGGLDVASSLDRATGDIAVRTVELPAPDIGDATALSFSIGRITDGLTSTQSILPTDDTRPTRWRRLLELIADQDLTTGQRDGYVAQLDGEMGDIRSSIDIKNDAGTISLGGQRSKIPLVITNSSTTPLRVQVRFSSSKLDFPDNGQIVEIDAAEKLLEIPVRVKSSGRFTVTVEIFTADGLQVLVGPTAISAQATILTGLAQVVTGAFALILATWWLQHVRVARRRRLAATAESLGHHPSNGGSESDGPADPPAGGPDDATVVQ